jgi:hypothetical protein
MKAKKSQVLPDPEPRQINAKFQSRLKGILEEISQSLLVIEPAVVDVSVPLREFIDYLEFEITKVQLEISRQKWQSVVDVQKVATDEAWLSRLVDLRNEFDLEKMLASIATIRSTVAKIEATFQV